MPERDEILQLYREQSDRDARIASELENLCERMGRVEDLERDSNAKLGRLVELGEKRDRREEAAEAARLDREKAIADAELAERKERTARGTWIRSLLTPQVALAIATALSAAATGAWSMRISVPTSPPLVQQAPVNQP